jgi:hypothetical protein
MSLGKTFAAFEDRKTFAHIDTQRLGIEPRFTGLEAGVLPLHYLCLVAVVGVKPTFSRL